MVSSPKEVEKENLEVSKKDLRRGHGHLGRSDKVPQALRSRMRKDMASLIREWLWSLQRT